MPRAIYRPLIPITIALVSGILLGESFPGQFIPVIGLCFLSVLGIALQLKRHVTLLWAPFILFLTIGYLSIQPWMAPRFPHHHITNYADAQPNVIVGHVLNDPDQSQSKKRTRFVMAVESIQREGRAISVCGRLRVTVSGTPITLRKGDHVDFNSRIREIRNFNNPGGFDYERYMAFQNIWARSYVTVDKLAIRRAEPQPNLITFIDKYRGRIAGLIDSYKNQNTIREQGVRAISKALLIGDRREISESLRDSFNRSGVGHLLAISGLHIGIVATVVFMSLRWCLSWIRPVLWLGGIRKIAAICTFIPVLAYGFLAGMSPSTQRAVLMVSVFLLTLLLDREHDLFNTIFIAAFLILVIHPPALFSISFQLSFAAVLVIVAGMSLRIYDPNQIKSVWRTLFLRLLTFMAVTICATLGTAPLVMTYFNQISVIGLLANMLAVPLVGFLVVPLGLLAIVLQNFSIELAGIILGLSQVILDKTIGLIEYFGALPFAAVKTITPNWIETSLFYCLLGSIFYLGQQKLTGKGMESASAWQRRLAYGTLIVTILGVVLDVGYWSYERFWRRDLRITFFDVGQGSSALLELPRGHNVLMDGGGFADSASFDTGKYIIAPYLLQRKIKTVHTLFLSHPNSDHLNGLIYIARHFNVRRAITNNEPSQTQGYRLFIEALENNDIELPLYQDMQRVIRIGDVSLEILYPVSDFLERKTREKWRNKNNNSLVVRVSLGRQSFLFPGDIMNLGEKELVSSAGNKLRSTVLIAPHHGSNTSSSSAFLQHVQPELVVVSCGWRNRYNFPAYQVLRRYEEMDCSVVRTDLNGAIIMKTNGDDFTIRTHNGDDT